MSSGFFSIDDDGNLLDVSEVDFDSEDTLQGLIAKYPRLLSGDEGAIEAPIEWLFVAREMGIPSEENQGNRWSLDHLFLDHEGVPTLVEVKRSTDSRIRREVVGQMLDYAANSSLFWPVEKIRESFAATCNGQSVDADKVIAEFLGPEVEPETFWERVKTNLNAGKMRLIFLADELPIELRRIIEFLNKQMDPTEVMGIEVKQYGAEGFKALTSRTIGRTATAPQRASTGRRWDEEQFLAAVRENGQSDDEQVSTQMFDWARKRNLRLAWGAGRMLGSCYPVLDIGNQWNAPFAAWTDLNVEIQLGTLKRREQFESDESRLELLERLNNIPSVQIEPNRIAGYPKIAFSTLREGNNLDRYLEVMDWAIGVLENGYTLTN